MSAAAITLAALLVASPSTSDVDRIAANGGFLIGSAHRCNLENERVVNAGKLVRGLINAAAADKKSEEDATARFSAFFLVSAFADPKQESLLASCGKVSAELAELEQHQTGLVGSEPAAKPGRPFGPGDGE